MYETRVHPELEYSFNHELTHEVAFRAVPDEPRRGLHARIVAATEALYPDRILEHAERLASHAFNGKVWDKAVRYCWKAGAKAAAHSVHREAVSFFEQALVALQHLPDSRVRSEQAIDLRCELRNSLFVLREQQGLLQHLRTAESLAEALGDQRRLGRVTSYMTRYFSAEGDFDQVLSCGRRALGIGETLGDVALQVETRFQLGREYYILGEYRRAIALFTKNVEALQGELRGQRFGLPFVASAATRSWLVRCLAELGDFAEGMAYAEEAIRIAEERNDALSLADARYCVGHLCLLRGDFAQAVSALEGSLALVRSSNLRIIFSGTAAALALAYARSGQFGQALPLLDQAMKQSDGRWSQWVATIGEAYLVSDCSDEALTITERALKTADARQRSFHALLLQLSGEIAARSNPPEVERAEGSYRGALALATELGMRPLVAHCHRSLAKLYQRTGKRQEAQEYVTTATTMYRGMGMVYWLEQAEAEVKTLT